MCCVVVWLAGRRICNLDGYVFEVISVPAGLTELDCAVLEEIDTCLKGLAVLFGLNLRECIGSVKECAKKHPGNIKNSVEKILAEQFSDCSQFIHISLDCAEIANAMKEQMYCIDQHFLDAEELQDILIAESIFSTLWHISHEDMLTKCGSEVAESIRAKYIAE